MNSFQFDHSVIVIITTVIVRTVLKSRETTESHWQYISPPFENVACTYADVCSSLALRLRTHIESQAQLESLDP